MCLFLYPADTCWVSNMYQEYTKGEMRYHCPDRANILDRKSESNIHFIFLFYNSYKQSSFQ